MWFEDAQLGTRFTTTTRTLTETDLVNFAGVSGDFNKVHMDEHAMADTDFGHRIMHGLLVFSIANGLRSQTGVFDDSIYAFAEVRSWKFLKPVYIGETIHAVTEIVDRRETSKPGRGIIVQQVDVINQDGVTVQSGELVAMMLSRPTGE